MKIKSVKGGFNKRWTSNSDFDENVCPYCKEPLEEIADWYESPSDDKPHGQFITSTLDGMPHLVLCEVWRAKKDSMESTFSRCKKCNKTFVFWETGDYDVFHLQEVTISE